MLQISGQCEVSEAIEGDVTVIHQGKDQGDIPTLVGQPLEAAEVWDRLVKSVGIKIKLRPSHSPPTAPGLSPLPEQEGSKTKARNTRILAPGSGLCCLQTPWL